MPNEKLAGSYYFTLNLGGAEAAGYFKECTGLTSEHTVVEHTAADAKGKSIIQKFPGQHEVVEHHVQARHRRPRCSSGNGART